jgi:hypothetical protein
MIKPHIPVSDTDYFALLPPAGLALAEDQARDYLAEARQDSELPTRDTALGLALIQAVKQGQEVRS